MRTDKTTVAHKWMSHLWLGPTLVHTDYFDAAPTKEELKQLARILPADMADKMIAAITKAPDGVMSPGAPYILEFPATPEFRNQPNYIAVEYGEVRTTFSYLEMPRHPGMLKEEESVTRRIARLDALTGKGWAACSTALFNSEYSYEKAVIYLQQKEAK